MNSAPTPTAARLAVFTRSGWRRESRFLTVSFGLAFLVVLLFIGLAWSRRWTSDDGFIGYRIVQQIKAGNGPVFNVGERVEATTTPLWIAKLLIADVLLPVRLEFIGVFLGIGLSTAGLIASAKAAHELWERPAGLQNPVLLPLGLLIYAALPVAWDFATAGLENGLSLAWLGITFLVIVRWRAGAEERGAAVSSTLAEGDPAAGDHRRARGFYVPFTLIGMGPLVRPDFAIFSAAFVGYALLVARRDDWWRVIVSASGPTLVWQIFRMGYYGAILPNTALAKQATVSWWDQGWRYVTDFAEPYALVLPISLGMLAFMIRIFRSSTTRTRLLALTPVVAGIVHALYVTRVGGDFMHGRLLLPALFAILCPIAVVPTSRSYVGIFSVVAAWALVCVAFLRPDYSRDTGARIIEDERVFYRDLAGRAHPVTVDDYDSAWAGSGKALRRLATESPGLFLTGNADFPTEWKTHPRYRLRGDVGARLVARTGAVGMVSYAAGPDVIISDDLGLADPIAARGRIGEVRGRPGHEKVLPMAWNIARYVDPRESVDQAVADPQQVDAAREALACPELRALRAATRGPLTPARFIRNLVWAVEGTSLAFSLNPTEARDELC